MRCPCHSVTERFWIIAYLSIHVDAVRQKSPDKVYAAWYKIVPQNYSVHTKPLGFENGVLTIEVASSTLYAILAAQEKFNLLNELQRKLPSYEIRDLVFKR